MRGPKLDCGNIGPCDCLEGLEIPDCALYPLGVGVRSRISVVDYLKLDVFTAQQVRQSGELLLPRFMPADVKP